MLDDHTITTVYKIIGGLSADNFGLDFGKNYCDRQSPNTTGNVSTNSTLAK